MATKNFNQEKIIIPPSMWNYEELIKNISPSEIDELMVMRGINNNYSPVGNDNAEVGNNEELINNNSPSEIKPVEHQSSIDEHRCIYCGVVCKNELTYMRHISLNHDKNGPLTKGGRAKRTPLASEIRKGMEEAGSGILRLAKLLGVSREYLIKWAPIVMPDEWKEYKSRKIDYYKRHGLYSNYQSTQHYKFNVEVLQGKHPAPKEWLQRPNKRMLQLMEYGLLVPRCEICGFDERRMDDGKTPLLLDFLDDDHANWKVDNLRVLCYNHFFTYNRDLWGKTKVLAFAQANGVLRKKPGNTAPIGSKARAAIDAAKKAGEEKKENNDMENKNEL